MPRSPLPFALCLCAFLACGWLTFPATAQEAATATTVPLSVSQLEAEPAGWTDLLPKGAGLPGWRRVAYPGKPLKPTDPWSVDATTGFLVCDGAGAVEMFLTEQEFGDGVFHVEWRLRPVEGRSGYNGGVFVRNSADGSMWHQAQVGDREDIGFLFGQTLKDGKPTSFRADDKVTSRGNPPGEWNTYEITCRGKEVSLWVNGATTATWKDCEVPRGLVGLEAEGWTIEFRSVKFKVLP